MKWCGCQNRGFVGKWNNWNLIRWPLPGFTKFFDTFSLKKLTPWVTKEKKILKPTETIDLIKFKLFFMLEGEAYLPTDIYVPAFEDTEQVEMKILSNISLCHGNM